MANVPPQPPGGTPLYNIPTGVQHAVLVFVRSLATPVMLYAENPQQLYDEIRATIRQADPKAPKLIEKPGLGPLKKFTVLDTELMGVALQTDPILSQR